ncbi:uncharacterized protein LOC131666049 isoform X1 [Phymastichus coffea]|uniref:uncharacterized protein LOC131666049 isoform X1 n=1 Tax=Phymastichus coffea TaxID=108790 RepID=UPI00273CB4AC|nr:uncharacterized protein LOC131666049 isoform X1 [Phymastichus coffea]XP_058794372.1 uncharacterized protein LOC131666049 isoform X1 [Phymastichus coffea]
MTVALSKYEELLQQSGEILDSRISEEALEKLKEKYKNHIHSKRILKDIASISSLLQVLKKRGILQYSNIDILRYINNEYVRDELIKQQIQDLITNYCQWLHENSNSINFLYNSAVVSKYSSMQESSSQLQLNIPFSISHTQINSTSISSVDRERELQNIVVIKLSKNIGNYWKDVCRSLNIDENIIDEINIEFSQEPPGQKYEKMFKRGMILYFSEFRPQWKAELLKALKIAKRVDLQEKVQEIIIQTSN